MINQFSIWLAHDWRMVLKPYIAYSCHDKRWRVFQCWNWFSWLWYWFRLLPISERHGRHLCFVRSLDEYQVSPGRNDPRPPTPSARVPFYRPSLTPPPPPARALSQTPPPTAQSISGRKSDSLVSPPNQEDISRPQSTGRVKTHSQPSSKSQKVSKCQENKRQSDDPVRHNSRFHITTTCHYSHYCDYCNYCHCRKINSHEVLRHSTVF